MEDDAVSPVIGVILMVAIAVILAAVVFVVVSSMTGDDIPPAGSMIGDRDEGKDTWRIIAGADRPQGDFSFMADKAGARYAWNETATSASPLLTVAPIAMVGDAPWGAGSYLSVCADGAVPIKNLEVSFINRATNVLAASTTFVSVDPCL